MLSVCRLYPQKWAFFVFFCTLGRAQRHVWPVGVHPRCSDGSSVQEKAKILLLQTCFITVSCLLLPVGMFLLLSPARCPPLFQLGKLPPVFHFLKSQKSCVELNMICALRWSHFYPAQFIALCIFCATYRSLHSRIHCNSATVSPLETFFSCLFPASLVGLVIPNCWLFQASGGRSL